MYDYKIVMVNKVVDGDTVDVMIDVGFRMTTVQRIRLLGVNTPERGEEGYIAAGELVKGWCDDRAGRLRIRTEKSDSFGRWLGDVYEPDGGNLSSALLAAGFLSYRR